MTFVIVGLPFVLALYIPNMEDVRCRRCVGNCSRIFKKVDSPQKQTPLPPFCSFLVTESEKTGTGAVGRDHQDTDGVHPAAGVLPQGQAAGHRPRRPPPHCWLDRAHLHRVRGRRGWDRRQLY